MDPSKLQGYVIVRCLCKLTNFTWKRQLNINAGGVNPDNRCCWQKLHNHTECETHIRCVMALLQFSFTLADAHNTVMLPSATTSHRGTFIASLPFVHPASVFNYAFHHQSLQQLILIVLLLLQMYCTVCVWERVMLLRFTDFELSTHKQTAGFNGFSTFMLQHNQRILNSPLEILISTQNKSSQRKSHFCSPPALVIELKIQQVCTKRGE